MCATGSNSPLDNLDGVVVQPAESTRGDAGFRTVSRSKDTSDTPRICAFLLGFPRRHRSILNGRLASRRDSASETNFLLQTQSSPVFVAVQGRRAGVYPTVLATCQAWRFPLRAKSEDCCACHDRKQCRFYLTWKEQPGSPLPLPPIAAPPKQHQQQHHYMPPCQPLPLGRSSAAPLHTYIFDQRS